MEISNLIKNCTVLRYSRFTNLSSAKVLHIYLVKKSAADEMENDEEVENVDNEYLLHSNDESLLPNDTQLLIMNNESSLNSKDSLQTPGKHKRLFKCSHFYTV